MNTTSVTAPIQRQTWLRTVRMRKLLALAARMQPTISAGSDCINPLTVGIKESASLRRSRKAAERLCFHRLVLNYQDLLFST